MDTETMIRELKSVEEKHKHDKVFTGHLNIAEMAYDTRKRLEELKPYEDTGLTPEQIIKIHGQSRWIPVEKQLPKGRINPMTNDFYEYQVTAKFGECVDIRHYKFGRGHWWHGPAIVDKYVIAWQPIPEPYEPKEGIQ